MSAENFVEPGTCRYPEGPQFEQVRVQKKAEFWGCAAVLFGMVGIVGLLAVIGFAPDLLLLAIAFLVAVEGILVFLWWVYTVLETPVYERVNRPDLECRRGGGPVIH